MKSTVGKSVALILSVMFLFFNLPGKPTFALDNPDKGTTAFDERIPPDGPLPDLSDLRSKKESRSATHKKLASQLVQLVDPSLLPKGKTKDDLLKQMENMKMVTYGKGKSSRAAQAKVYIKLQPGADAGSLGSLVKIKNKDLENNLVVADVDVDKLEALAELDAVESVQPVLPPVVYKVNSSEGIDMHHVDDALAAGGTDGTGIKVGVISDGVNSIDDAIISGDLPAGVTVLSDVVGGDEGTAMLEIVYDMAPGADLYFHDCGEDWVEFNNAIDALVAAGCTVIVDDIGWITQPFYEDGIIANHIEDLVNAGQIVYVTSAGNAAKYHYQGKFYNDGTGFHDFSLGKNPSYKQLYVSLDPGESVMIVLQWSDYFGASANDYDLFLIKREDLSPVWWSMGIQNGNDYPVEFILYTNETADVENLAVYVDLDYGVSKNLELYMYPGYGVAVSAKNIVTSNSIFGHAAVPGVLTCGAIDHRTPSTIEGFSSLGPVAMIGDVPGQPSYTRQKPDICGADGVAVTGAGNFPSEFYGTSAAAPHVAAIAALVWSKHPEFSAQQVRNRILDNAVDLGTAGYDNTYGFGRADAYSSVLDFYAVSYNTGGGSACSTTKVPSGSTVTAPTTTRTGYTFDGWYREPELATPWNLESDTVTTDITLYAKWKLKSYKVSFNSCGGTAVDPVTADYTTTIAAPSPAPTRDGFTLGGWYKDVACTQAWDFASSTVPPNDITLYARWVALAPANPVAGSASYNSVRISWDAVTGVTGYKVYRASSPTGSFVAVGSTTGLSYVNTGLVTNTVYYYKVRAYYVSGVNLYGEWSSPIVSARPKPAAPATISASSASYNSIKLSWGSVAGSSGYEIYRGYSVDGTFSKLTTTTATSFTNTGLVTGTAYYYQVRAYRLVGSVKVYGAFSVAKGAIPTLSTPAAFKAARASATSIKVTWGAVTGSSGYEIWRSATPVGNYVQIKATTSTYFTNTGLTTGQLYYYKVRAYRMVGSTKVYGSFTAYSAAKP